jgi:phosphohistidine phosphatase
MKSLTILRHAKSSRDEPGLDDFDRPLNERGRKAARQMGKELKRRKMRFDLVLASAAVRVQETLEDFTAGYGEDLEIGVDSRIYEATVQTLIGVIRAVPDRVGNAMIVGHNPGLQQLVLALASDDGEGFRARVESKFPTAAAAVIELNIETWGDAGPGTGRTRELILPRELAD